ncbi:hypothetical protein [Caenibius tardaugens]|nr:hypothetical protein [Caenibius tardaugens]AZI35797.1 hypothetical protein EGO55_07250 [Caenibius tardaugens NBRC 16725]
MTLKLQPSLLCISAILTLGLAGCGGNDTAADGTSEAAAGATPATSAAATQGASTPSAAPTLAQGPDVCFRAIAKHLGADTKVAEITSFFSAGSKIDSNDSKPEGEMTTCTVEYQNPDDPRKLLSTRLDIATGTFAPPSPVEITVMGNAADFRLEDHLIPLSQLNPAALTGVMDAQKADLGAIYSSYAWTGVRLSSPDSFNNKHTLRLDLTGRLAANDIKENGYASVTTDGKTITTNHLKP